MRSVPVLIAAILLQGVFSHAQTAPLKTNTIQIVGITFDSVVNALLDQGYTVAKVDKDFQTIQTDYKALTHLINIALYVRVKDSVATVTGKWWSRMFTNPQFGPGINDIYPVENKKAAALKLCFNTMDEFARSFNRPVEYLIKM